MAFVSQGGYDHNSEDRTNNSDTITAMLIIIVGALALFMAIGS